MHAYTPAAAIPPDHAREARDAQQRRPFVHPVSLERECQGRNRGMQYTKARYVSATTSHDPPGVEPPPRHNRQMRRRGLASSSIPKLINVKLAQSTATHNPAGTNCHHFPIMSAPSFCAQYNISPQLA